MLKRLAIHRIGERLITNQNLEVEIIEYFGVTNCTIRFIIDNTVIKKVNYTTLTRGEVKNPYYPSLYGVGYIGEGKYKSNINNKLTRVYRVWSSMMGRCYYNNVNIKKESYKNCLIINEWHNFQNFAKWYEENYIEGFELDKDILVKGNKVYGPDTCCFVPSIINTLFTSENRNSGKFPTGVRKIHNKFFVRSVRHNKEKSLGGFFTVEEAYEIYRKDKEYYIKQLAEEYKNRLIPSVYSILINYNVPTLNPCIY